MMKFIAFIGMTLLCFLGAWLATGFIRLDWITPLTTNGSRATLLLAGAFAAWRVYG